MERKFLYDLIILSIAVVVMITSIIIIANISSYIPELSSLQMLAIFLIYLTLRYIYG